jgi:surface carbohydrate biosynthesis protein (TIGR04326 family)
LTDNKPGIYITLLNSDPDSPERVEQFYHWNGHDEKDSLHSLQGYVEKHSERLRDKYLAWVHDLGESQIAGKRLIDHLAFEEGLSYWWMTRFVEKSVYKSPINDAIRFMAVEEIISKQKPAKFRLVSSNCSLNEAFSDLCMNLDITYEWKRLPGKSPWPLNLGCLYRALPHSAQALIGLVRHIWGRWPLRKAERAGWFGDDKSIFLCSYFFNMDPDLAEEGYFHSHYWRGLHDLMQKLGISANWLQHYYPHDAVPNPGIAIDWVQRFNQKQKTQGFHTFLDGYLSWGIILCVLKRWFGLTRTSRDLGEIKQAFRPQGMGISLWPLLREDWYASVCGRTAIDNLLFIELFDMALSDLPHQEMGFYLCENQAWERALINAWRKHGHGRLIAVVHATARFWDLRYYADPRTIRSSNPYPMPQADLTALNGKVAIDAYLRAGYPKEAIVECETLRYGYLNKVRAGFRKDKRTDKIKVLILGDYLSSCTIKMLQLLEEAQQYIAGSATYIMKPHPNYRVDPEGYPALKLEVVMEHLEKILHDFDVVYSSNKTSAALDAYIAGLPVVVMLDNAELNFSPLRGQSDVCFVNTSEELAEALQMGHQNMVNRPNSNDFFFLDPELPRWRKLLAPVCST